MRTEYRIPEQIHEAVKIAGCKLSSVRILFNRRGGQSYRIPIFTGFPKGEHGILYVPEGGKLVYDESEKTGKFPLPLIYGLTSHQT